MSAKARRRGAGGGAKKRAAEQAGPQLPADGRRPALVVAEVVLWLLVVAVPLVFVPTAREAFALPKRLLGEGLALASLLALAVDVALRRDAYAGLSAVWRRPLVRASALRATAPFLAVAFLCALPGRHPAHAGAALVDLAIGAAALVGWSLALDAHRLRRLLAGLLVPATLLGLLAILQFHDLFRPFGFADAVERERFGVTSLAGNAGYLGAFLALASVLGLAFLGTGGRRLRAAFGVALAVSLYALLVTETLTAVAALLAGGAVVAALRLPPRRVVAALTTTAVAVALLLVALPPLRERAAAKVEQVSEGDVNGLLTGRLDGWRTAVWMARRHAWSGVGPGGYAAEFSDAKLALLDDGVPFYRGHLQPAFANAHDEVLEVAAEMGLPGLAALAWGLWVLLGAARRVGRGDGGPASRWRRDRAAAWGGLTVLAVLSLGHFPFRIALTAFPALLLLAWIFRRGDELATGEAAVASNARDAAAAPPPPGSRLVAWLLVLLLAAALAAYTARARGLLRASRVQNTVERVTETLAARGPVPNTVLWTHLRLLREAEALAPAQAGLPLAAGSQYLLLGRPADAVVQYRRALALEPRPEAWLNLGRAQWVLGERQEAVASLLRAVRLDRRLLRQVPQPAREPVRRALSQAEAGG